MSGPAILRAYANQVGASVVERWGQIVVTHEAPFDLSRLQRTAEEGDLIVTGRFGVDYSVELRLSSDAPPDTDIRALQLIVPTEEEELSLLNPASGWVAAQNAQSVLTEIEVRYDQSNWVSQSRYSS